MLTRKILFLIIPIFLLFAVLDFLVIDLMVSKKLERLETQEAIEDNQRVQDAIERELYHLLSLCVDWSSWDDTYQFMVDRNARYIDANLLIDTFMDNHFNIMLFIKPDGTVFWRRLYNPSEKVEISIPEFEFDQFPANHPIMSIDDNDRGSGLFHTDTGLILVVHAPILTSGSEGPLRGTLVLGRYFDPEYQEIMEAQTRRKFDVIKGSFNEITKRKRKDLCFVGDNYLFDKSDHNVLSVYNQLTTIDGVNYLIESLTPRDIIQEGRITIVILWVSLMAVGLLITVAMVFTIEFLVIQPIRQLKEYVLDVGQNDIQGTPLYPKRHDEIGFLAQEFDKNYKQLFETRSRLLESSYKSGLSEMASNFLHNLRNSLTPLMGEIQGIRMACRKIDFNKYSKAHRELKLDKMDPERRERIMEYLTLLDSHNLDYHEEILQLFNSMDNYRKNIEELMDTQSIWTSAKPVVETVRLSDMAKDIHDFLSPKIRSRINLAFQFNLEANQIVRSYRVSVLMIISRLLEYIAQSCVKDEKINIQMLVDRAEVKNKQVLQLKISIPPELIPDAEFASVFAFDKNQNKNQMRSELLWCSNTAAAIGAKLSISRMSDNNSYFHIQVPLM